jgi:hypothetical protein
LMTGEKPFPGENITTVIYKIINEEPIPPRSLDSSIHPGLSAVITHALAKDPTARFQNCQELLDALKNYRDVADPETTVRISPVNQMTAGPGARAAPRPSLIPSYAGTNASEAVIRPLLAIQTEREPTKKSARVALTLILLGIIGYAGYRVWPPVLDVWQRMHVPAETTETPVKALPVAPAVNSEAPDTKSDDSPQAAPLVQKAAPAAAEESAAPSESSPPKASAKLPESAAAPETVEKPAPPQEPVAPMPTSAAHSLKSTLGSQLADISLADKVKLQVNGNTLTIFGQLTPHDHSKVLTLLHNVPGGVRVIDNIGFADELKGP